MKTAIILHGMPSKEEYFDAGVPSSSNQHFLPWIQRRLILRGALAQAIELPEPYAPVYEKWKGVFEQFTVNENTMLIGHSCGAWFLVRWLSEEKRSVGKVALVAPFLDPDGDEVASDFFHFELDEKIMERVEDMVIFNSTDDDKEIQDSVSIITSRIPGINVVELENRGHFTYGGMKTDKFPELESFLLD